MHGDHQDQVRRVRDALGDPFELAAALGLLDGSNRRTYKRLNAREIQVCCPWHSERNPSCSIAVGPDGTLYAKCHGCGESGDALTLIAAVEGLDVRRADDFRRVLDLGAEIGGVRIAGPRDWPATRRIVRPPPEPEGIPDDVFDAAVAALLAACPFDAPGAADVRDYLRARRLLPHVRGLWGALPDDADGLERARAAVIDAIGLDAWARSGLATAQGEFVYPENRVLIPWRAAGSDGVVVALQRRRLDDGKPKYVFSRGRRPSEPYGIDAALEDLGDDTAVVFVEGATDVVALRALYQRAGRDRVVLGVPGVENWRPEWARYAAGRAAFVALDADRAGDGKAEEIAGDLLAAGATDAQRLRPDGAKDWAELLARAA